MEKVDKSIVNIASVRMVQDQLFRLFPMEGVGSDVVIDNDGHVLTNNHVIDNAQRLKVTTIDGKTRNGTLVGNDDTTDLAVVRVDTVEGFTPAQLGDSDKLRVG